MAKKTGKNFDCQLNMRIDKDTKNMARIAKGLGIDVAEELRPIIKQHLRKRLRQKNAGTVLTPGIAPAKPLAS